MTTLWLACSAGAVFPSIGSMGQSVCTTCSFARCAQKRLEPWQRRVAVPLSVLRPPSENTKYGPSSSATPCEANPEMADSMSTGIGPNLAGRPPPHTWPKSHQTWRASTQAWSRPQAGRDLLEVGPVLVAREMLGEKAHTNSEGRTLFGGPSLTPRGRGQGRSAGRLVGTLLGRTRRNRHKLSRTRPTWDGVGQKFAQFGRSASKSVEPGLKLPKLANFDLRSGDVGPKSDQIAPSSALFLATSVEIGPTSGQISPDADWSTDLGKD